MNIDVINLDDSPLPSRAFLKVVLKFKAFIKPFEAPQESVKKKKKKLRTPYFFLFVLDWDGKG